MALKMGHDLWTAFSVIFSQFLLLLDVLFVIMCYSVTYRLKL